MYVYQLFPGPKVTFSNGLFKNDSFSVIQGSSFQTVRLPEGERGETCEVEGTGAYSPGF